MRRFKGLARLLGVLSALASLTAAPVFAQTRPSGPIPDGAELVRLLGSRATLAFASPNSPGIGALVRLPPGQPASALGLREVAPGIARLWDTPTGLIAFGQAHPELPIEVAPRMRLLLDAATSLVRVPKSARLEREVAASGAPPSTVLDGTGAVVGIADTGVDVTHPDFLDATGRTRVAWLLDLGAPPRGVWPALEQAYGLTDPTIRCAHIGSRLVRDDINDRAMSMGQHSRPSSGLGRPRNARSVVRRRKRLGRQVGLPGCRPCAPRSWSRVSSTRAATSLGTTTFSAQFSFLYDQADALHLPIVVNLSVGSDFGPHDGTMAWEEVLASHVGPEAPGHILIAAAGNSGSIAPQRIHRFTRMFM
jgi:hypothetical protein